jgi:hypothetical protein
LPDFELYTIEESELTISNGSVLSGFSQGTGVHLLGETITLNSNDFQVVTVTDNDAYFADNDGNQSLTTDTTYDGVSYSAGLGVEAEYTLIVQDPDGNTYTLIGFNINEAGVNPAFQTVEGLAFLGDFPPVGVPLTVIDASEGPTQTQTFFTEYYTPPCFVEGTLIQTPSGVVSVETLGVGDLVTTMDHGPQPVRWIGHSAFSRAQLDRDPRLCPVRLVIDGRTLTVSPQHRIYVGGWAAEIACGEDVLVAAKHIAEAGRARALRPEELGPEGVRYWHILFDRHEIVYSEGIPTESFRPGPEAMKSIPEVQREFERLFPDSRPEVGQIVAARRLATRHEAWIVSDEL